MPQMGESITEGTLTRWLKKIGDSVERDEMIFEISTDKVDAEIPSPSAGTLLEIKVKEGETVEVGTIVAVVGAAGEAASNGSATVSAGEAESKMPETEATASGDTELTAGAPVDGTTPETAAAQVASDISASTGADQAAEIVTAQETTPVAAPPTSQTSAAREASDEEESPRRSSPLVRNIARENNIDISRVEGTGASGRVTKTDIMSFIESGANAKASPAPSAPSAPAAAPRTQVQPPVQTPSVQTGEGDRVETMSVMRRKIAEHMIMSQTVSAHVSTVYEIDMTQVARSRDRHKAAFLERTGTKLTYMPFIFQAVTNAIREFPVFNSQVSGDQIIYKRDINLGMAVALDWGLIVPVIKRADELSISGLARTANDLADRARNKQLKPDEVAGGTFTITNPGVFGGLFGTPLINQPQVAILAVGTIEKRPRVIITDDGDEVLAIRTMAHFALSYDHRVIDGSDAEKFLGRVKQTLEAGQFAV